MKAPIRLDILPQPDDFTCGPTCLQAVYRYFKDEVPLERVIEEVPDLEEGGTLGILLGCHALRRGYRVTIYSYNLQAFDPTWFAPGGPDLSERLKAQARIKKDPKLQTATAAYLEFLARGGQLHFEDLTPGLIRKYLDRSIPVLAGLSATYLYRCAREYGPETEYDDVRGEPAGHFVVLCGYDHREKNVLIADPYQRNPVSRSQHYVINIDRVIGAILLGILTYDANLLIIEPKKSRARHGDVRRRK